MSTSVSPSVSFGSPVSSEFGVNRAASVSHSGSQNRAEWDVASQVGGGKRSA